MIGWGSDLRALYLFVGSIPLHMGEQEKYTNSRPPCEKQPQVGDHKRKHLNRKVRILRVSYGVHKIYLCIYNKSGATCYFMAHVSCWLDKFSCDIHNSVVFHVKFVFFLRFWPIRDTNTDTEDKGNGSIPSVLNTPCWKSCPPAVISLCIHWHYEEWYYVILDLSINLLG